MSDAFVGFDSAWADKSPGAVCFAVFDGDRLIEWQLPKPARFCDALRTVKDCHNDESYTLVALDQPTMVPNASGMRPVERVAGSVKAGVLPAYLNSPWFGRSAPIWEFLNGLTPQEDPRNAQRADEGLHLIEVFPGLALPSLLSPPSCQLPVAMQYNPSKRSKFSIEDWQRVATGLSSHLSDLDLEPFSEWVREQVDNPKPSKGDQDCLDALICLVIALKWRRRDQNMEVLGDWRGHMVTPLSEEAKHKIRRKASKLDVPMGCGSWHLHDLVLSCFDGDHYDAFEWLAHPNPALGGDSPLEKATTPDGMRVVTDLIGRLNHGIPA